MIETVLITIIGLVALWEYRKRRDRQGELPPAPVTNYNDGSMLKAIKITMGVVFGLFLAALLLSLGWVAILGALTGALTSK